MPTKAGIIYGLAWRTVENNDMGVTIYDNSVQIDAAADETLYLMQPSATPLRISVTNNEEDKFSPIRAKKATITFLNDDSFNYQTFATGEDERFYVEATCDSINIFRGWLEQGDIHEPFLSQNNQEVILTAVDGLAQLKGIPLTDFTGANPTGKHTLIEYITWCTRKTGLYLNTYVVNNLKEQDSARAWRSTAQFTATNQFSVPFGYVKYFRIGHTINISGSGSNNGNKVITGITDLGFLGGILTVSGSGIVNEAGGPLITFEDVSDAGHIYARQYEDAKTFEDKIGTCVDCYTVLEKILKRDCFIEQRLGDWWIIRVKEMRQDFAMYTAQFDNQGNFSTITTSNYQKAIGLKDVAGTPFPASPDAISYFSQAATSRTILRPNKSVKLIFKYQLPSEIPCNVDFSRGAFIANLPDEIIDGITYTVKSYQIECWTYVKNPFNPDTLTNPPDEAAYIKKYFNSVDSEFGRNIVLPMDADLHALFSEGILIDKNDKFDISIDFKGTQGVDFPGPVVRPYYYVYLDADDGTNWFLWGDGQWHQSNSTWATNVNGIRITETPIDSTKFTTASVSSRACPADGIIYIAITNSPSSDIAANNLQFDYFAFINNTYQKYSGQSNKTTRDGVYKAKIEDEIFITNSPKKLFKGALWKKHPVTSVFMLAGLFYEGQEFYYGNDGVNNLKSYGELQVRAVHNQYRNGDETVQLTAQGFNGAGYIDLIDRIYNRDLESATNNRAFQLVWMDQDWKRCEWTGTMIKNFDLVIGFVQDSFEFKYES